MFSKQKFQFGSILEGLEVEHVGLFYGHLEYILRQFGISIDGNMVKCW
jgi:hypothetical protein